MLPSNSCMFISLSLARTHTRTHKVTRSCFVFFISNVQYSQYSLSLSWRHVLSFLQNVKAWQRGGPLALAAALRLEMARCGERNLGRDDRAVSALAAPGVYLGCSSALARAPLSPARWAPPAANSAAPFWMSPS